MIKIRQLKCTVRVRTGRKNSPTHRGEAPPRPALTFALPILHEPADEMPSPSQMATQGGTAAPSAAKKADPRAVADRVYDLMKDELRLAQLRGGRDWRN